VVFFFAFSFGAGAGFSMQEDSQQQLGGKVAANKGLLGGVWGADGVTSLLSLGEIFRKALKVGKGLGLKGTIA